MIAMKITWTQKAIDENQKNIDFLMQRWNKKVLANYLHKLDSTLDMILKNPRIGVYDRELKCHKFLVVEQIYLFYEHKGYELFVLSIWNNAQKPLI